MHLECCVARLCRSMHHWPSFRLGLGFAVRFPGVPARVPTCRSPVASSAPQLGCATSCNQFAVWLSWAASSAGSLVGVIRPCAAISLIPHSSISSGLVGIKEASSFFDSSLSSLCCCRKWSRPALKSGLLMCLNAGCAPTLASRNTPLGDHAALCPPWGLRPCSASATSRDRTPAAKVPPWGSRPCLSTE